jgi:hypothetical protein
MVVIVRYGRGGEREKGLFGIFSRDKNRMKPMGYH